MKEIIERITSYNIFNYLVPGIIFTVIAEHITEIQFVPKDLHIIIVMFLYYFIGLVVSRVGSLIIEPILKKLLFIKHDPPGFQKAQKRDSTITVFLEVCNSYRTLCSGFLLILFLKILELLGCGYWVEKYHLLFVLLGIVALFIIFLYAYKKQNNYINQRIKDCKDNLETN